MISKAIRWIGIGLFAISFFMPAVGMPGGGWGPDHLPGYLCALLSLLFPLWAFRDALRGRLTFFELSAAGLVVPMVLFYFFLCLEGWESKPIRTRRVLAVAILLGLADAWCAVQFPGSRPDPDKFTPMIGHYLWTVGILLILAPEIIPVSAGDPKIA
jgi:hypothetical protein